MELTFNGHACVTLRSGRRDLVVVTDPYLSGAFDGKIGHAPLQQPSDIVTVSHYHVDHSHIGPELGTPQVVDMSTRVRGLEFTAVSTYHDRHCGARMGMTTMFCWEMDGLRVAHLGDIGCDLTSDDVRRLGKIDLLMWPVGGTYTLGPRDAIGVLQALKPRWAVPLHYENERCQLGMEPIEATVAALASHGIPVRRLPGSSMNPACTNPGVVAPQPAL